MVPDDEVGVVPDQGEGSDGQPEGDVDTDAAVPSSSILDHPSQQRRADNLSHNVPDSQHVINTEGHMIIVAGGSQQQVQSSQQLSRVGQLYRSSSQQQLSRSSSQQQLSRSSSQQQVPTGNSQQQQLPIASIQSMSQSSQHQFPTVSLSQQLNRTSRHQQLPNTNSQQASPTIGTPAAMSHQQLPHASSQQHLSRESGQQQLDSNRQPLPGTSSQQQIPIVISQPQQANDDVSGGGEQDAGVPSLDEDVDDNSQMSDVGGRQLDQSVVDMRATTSDPVTEESQLSSQVQHVDTQVQDSQQAGPSTQNTSIPATKRKERPGPTSEELLQTIVQETRSKRHKSSEKAKKLLQKLLAGTPVKPHVRRAGQYLIGPKLGISPVKCIQHCLGRKDGTDRYYLLKILHLGIGTKETQDERQGKMLLHTENSLLTLLEAQPGVIQKHATFTDIAFQEEETGVENNLIYTGRQVKRVVLVLDCVAQHSFSNQTQDLVNLQHHVIREKKLSERETLVIFSNVVSIVENLHNKNIVHRDLKLGNIVLDKRNHTVTLTNFCLGKHLMRQDDPLKDQRGSPAYISPDVLSGKPYLGKPSDMWALGVVLYTMLYGQFPFYDNVPQELFNKIKAADYSIPEDGRVSEDTRQLIRRLLVTDPSKRLTATQVKQNVESIILMWRHISPSSHNLQVVPTLESYLAEQRKANEFSLDSNMMLNIPLQREYISEAPKKTSKHRRSGKTGQIPVHKLGEDARPLTAEEYRMYNQVISQMRGVRSKHTRPALTQNQVLVRSDRLNVYQPDQTRPANLSDPSTINSVPATVPDHTEVLDLSQGSRRSSSSGPSSRSSNPPYLGQGLPAPTHSRPSVNRSSSSSALSLVGALRRLGTRVNLVPINDSGNHRSSSSRESSSRSSRRHRHHHHHHHSTSSQFIDLRHLRDASTSTITSSSSQTQPAVAASIITSSVYSEAATPQAVSIAGGIMPVPAPVTSGAGPSGAIAIDNIGGIAMGLGEATRLLGITLEPISRLNNERNLIRRGSEDATENEENNGDESRNVGDHTSS